MKTSIAKALFQSHSYIEYRKLISDLLRQQQSTSKTPSEELTHYSSLNDTRMQRLDKTMVVPETIISKLTSLKETYIWLVISEGWCGDAAQLLPIFNKMALASDGIIDLRIVLRDENEELMQLFLTNKTKAIPKLIVIHKETSGALAHWGPRPKDAADLITDYKKTHGTIDEAAKTALQLWYLQDKGRTTQLEVLDMMLDLDNPEV
ncbi:thioredoxin family protein [Flavobacterium crassostreae]|uniref:Thioredoxin n=1 Tax=Flavobacterium crassostreae TaxID=1763534 RepID=A0A1B9E614_9FLAO|nr:thioredoxin family protein [Flavobacterium crassostreae]OCB77375.1 thioredoxin [Flavobacterium crassostreae]